MSGTVERLRAILAPLSKKGIALDPATKTLTRLAWWEIADMCKSAGESCAAEDDGVWFVDGKLTIEDAGGRWVWRWTEHPNALEESRESWA